MQKRLVAYFSAGGVTARTAKLLSEVAGADLYEIRPETLYTAADLDWTNRKSRSTVEMNDPASRPALAETPRVEGYDVIFLGFPIWWGVAPTILQSFLESADFSGKILVPFATSGGSGFGSRTLDRLRGSCSKTALWKQGKLLNGVTRQKLAEWVESLGL